VEKFARHFVAIAPPSPTVRQQAYWNIDCNYAWILRLFTNFAKTVDPSVSYRPDSRFFEHEKPPVLAPVESSNPPHGLPRGAGVPPAIFHVKLNPENE
jgi:hypothetical protein